MEQCLALNQKSIRAHPFLSFPFLSVQFLASPFLVFLFLSSPPFSSFGALKTVLKENVSYAVSGFIPKTYADTYKHAQEGQ